MRSSLFLSKSFGIKDVREADVILNIKLIKGRSEIILLQSHYVEKVLSLFGFMDCKSSPTSYDPSVTLKRNKRTTRDQLRHKTRYLDKFLKIYLL